MLRIGSIVFAVDMGIGILAKDFFDNGVVTDVMVVRHGKRPERDDWYPEAERISNLAFCGNWQKMEDLCRQVDVMLFFETPFRWELINYCRSIGKKTVLMPMFECMPKVLPHQPDLFLCPSLLDLSYYPSLEWDEVDGTEIKYQRSVYLPVPVDVPWRQRTRAEVFVHNAGHGGLKGRNGTRELLEAMRFVESPVKFIIRSQEPLDIPLALGYSVTTTHSKVVEYGDKVYDYRIGTFPRDTLYDEGDVFMFPEKFNGLSLPLQEARAAGMLVMSTDRFPMNAWLPRCSLIPKSGVKTNSVSPRCNDFEEAIIDPRDIAAAIDQWYGADIAQHSLNGREWARENSWEVLKPKYLNLLEELCKAR